MNRYYITSACCRRSSEVFYIVNLVHNCKQNGQNVTNNIVVNRVLQP